MAQALPGIVLQELQTWMNHVSQTWHQIVNGKDSGETGIDIGLPYHTPIYAVTSGNVIGAGYYGGGGVVSIQSAINYDGINGPASIYYQHLDQNLVSKGQFVTAGQLIGYSGGQLSGGLHPSTRQFSNGPHIEIGINAPYGANGIWANLGKNVNPLTFFKDLAQNNTSVLGTGAGNPNAGGDINTGQTSSNPFDIGQGLRDAGNALLQKLQNATGITSISDLGWRAAFVFLGFIILLVAIIVIAFDLLDRSNIEIAGSRV